MSVWKNLARIQTRKPVVNKSFDYRRESNGWVFFKSERPTPVLTFSPFSDCHSAALVCFVGSVTSACCAVAWYAFRAGPSGSVVGVPEVPCVAVVYRVAASWARENAFGF